MYKSVAVVLLLSVVALASGTTCDSLNILKVKSQWARAYSHGHSREHFAEAVWRTAFNLSPSIKDRFHQHGVDDVHSPKFRAYALRTLGAVDLSVTFLDHPDELKAELAYMHKQQEERHIPDEFLDTFIKALGHVVPAQLGRCWDREAWKACFATISAGIKGHD